VSTRHSPVCHNTNRNMYCVDTLQLAAFVVGVALLIFYLYNQFLVAGEEENASKELRDEILIGTMQRRIVSLMAAMGDG
jgi:hypothetical protein